MIRIGNRSKTGGLSSRKVHFLNLLPLGKEIKMNQILWTSTFGLILKLITEREYVTEKQRKDLIDHHFKVLLQGIIAERRKEATE